MWDHYPGDTGSTKGRKKKGEGKEEEVFIEGLGPQDERSVQKVGCRIWGGHREDNSHASWRDSCHSWGAPKKSPWKNPASR